MHDRLNKKILVLAGPFLAANISIPLLGMVDTAVLGHLSSEKYLGAIALGGMVFSFLFWGFGFLKMGTTGFCAQARGARDQEAIALVLRQGLLAALVLGGAMFAVSGPLWRLVVLFLEGSPEVMAFAGEYFSLRIYSAPAVFLLYVLTGWFLGMQNAVYVLYVTILENVSNILFDVTFVYVFGMRSDGVALGTVCAQYLALLFAFILLAGRYRATLKRQAAHAWLSFRGWSRYLRVNADILIRTVTLMLAFAFFTVKSSALNDVLLAANTVLLQFLMLFAYVADGLAHAGQSLSGYFYGARDFSSLKKLIGKLFVWCLFLALAFSVAYGLLFREMLTLLTSQPSVIDTALHFRWWLAVLPLLSFGAFIWDGIYIGLTQTALLRNAMLLSFFGVYLPVFYFSYPMIGSHALWLSMSSFMLARGVSLWLFSRTLKLGVS